MGLLLLLLAVLLFPATSFAQATMPADYQAVLTALGKQGDFKDNVLRVNVPRNDLHVSVDGVATPTPFGFGGWLAMTKGAGGMDVMMGDLELTEDEVNPVMSALLTIWLDTAALATIVGADGEQNGAVYKITIGRPDIPLKEMGASINARMGLNTWAAFYGSDADAVVAGDVAMLDREVTPVLKALRSNGIDVVAIHHHMTGTTPPVIFLHYWGKGDARKLATAFRGAIDQTGARPPR